MTTVYERNAPRLRELLSFLDAQGVPTPKEELFAHVKSTFPPEGDELDTVSDGTPRWMNDLYWQTTNLVKAGWMTKDGRGTWCSTDEGQKALNDFTDALQFQAEAVRRYYEWQEAQKAEQRRAWLVRGSSVRGANVVHEWLEGGWVSIPASQLRPIEPGISSEALAAAAREDYEHLKHQELKSKVDEILTFVTRITPGDIILTTNDERIYVGDVTADWTWQRSDGGRSNLRRAVDWRNSDAPIDFSELPPPLPAKLASGATVVDLTSEIDLIDNLATLVATSTDVTGTEAPPSNASLAHPSPTLAEELFVDPGWLAGVRDLLAERKQIIFYGPPGTGKTYLARKLANDLVGPEQVKLVQFHPSYSYEDFFEGYRPLTGTGGTIAFELRPGPLRQLVSRAVEHRDQSFVLIVDEINRANLAKVFGELYFLLEYRDEAVDLLYSAGDEPFSLPPNIYLIGTMNTADRSIALIDAAMRRRFAFVALDPRTEPTHSLLRRWSEYHGLPMLAADLLDELNCRIDDPDFQIGPSYFMRTTGEDAFSDARLARIWSADIRPLLEEHFYGQWSAVASRFALSSIRNAVAASPDAGIGGTSMGPDVEVSRGSAAAVSEEPLTSPTP